jgi:hypothetical protein
MGTAEIRVPSSAASQTAAASGAGAAATPAAPPGAGAAASAAPAYTVHELSVVIKVYFKDLVERRVTRTGHPIFEDAKSELRLHAALCRQLPNSPPSPHVVRLYDLRSDAQHYFAVLEYCTNGEFFAFVAQVSAAASMSRLKEGTASEGTFTELL